MGRYKNYNRINHLYFGNPKDFCVSYFAGVLYGDGCVCSKRNTVRLSMVDRDVVVEFAKAIGLGSEEVREYDLNKWHLGKAWSKQSSLYVTSQQMVADLVQFSVVPNKKYVVCRYPEGIVDRGFLLGLYDADGTAGKSYFRYVGNQEMIESLACRIQQLGFEVTVYGPRRGVYSRSMCEMNVPCAGGNLKRYLVWLYDTDSASICCKRKLIRALKAGSISADDINSEWLKLYVNPEPSSLNGVNVSEKVQRLGSEEPTNNLPVEQELCYV